MIYVFAKFILLRCEPARQRSVASGENILVLAPLNTLKNHLTRQQSNNFFRAILWTQITRFPLPPGWNTSGEGLLSRVKAKARANKEQEQIKAKESADNMSMPPKKPSTSRKVLPCRESFQLQQSHDHVVALS
jgi:hypothetical protein